MDAAAQTSGFLDYGALGLLALVLVGIGLWVRQALSKNQQFMEKLSTGAIEAQAKYTDAFHSMSLRAITAQETASLATEHMVVCIKALTDQTAESHRNMADGLSKLRKDQLAIMKRTASSGLSSEKA